MHTRRRLTCFAATSTAVVLALTACTPGGEGGEGMSGAGWDNCTDDPNTCNSGERADGGEIVWIVNALPGAWSALSPEGGSVYTLQMLDGVHPYTGQWAPDGQTYEYNMDLLAAEPELLNEEAPLSYRFQLNPEAQWDDGTPITAEDFIVTWKMSTSEGEGHCEGCRPRSPGKYDRIASMESEDDGATVVVTMKDGLRDPEWFTLFSAHSASGGIYPAHVGEEQGFDLDDPAGIGEYFEWLNDNRPTYSGGPYRIVEGDLRNQVIKEPNENYYGEEQPTLDTIVVQYNDEEGSYVPALANGEIHGGNPAQYNTDVIEELEGMENVHSSVSPGAIWEHVDFNLENEWLEDVELRRAIFTAIDTQEIAERNFAAGYPDIEVKTNHLFDPGSPYFVDIVSETGQGSGDVDRALQILEDAGYEMENDTLTMDGEQVGPFRLRSTDTVTRSTSLQIIQGQLADIGVETNIEMTDDLGATLSSQDYDIMQFGWSGDPLFAEDPHEQWHSESASNFGGYSNEEVDELIEQVLNSRDLDEAAEYANQAVELVTQDAYVLPIAAEPNYGFVVDQYVNIRDNRQSSLRAFYNSAQWGLAAQ